MLAGTVWRRQPALGTGLSPQLGQTPAIAAWPDFVGHCGVFFFFFLKTHVQIIVSASVSK